MQCEKRGALELTRAKPRLCSRATRPLLDLGQPRKGLKGAVSSALPAGRTTPLMPPLVSPF
jgi:hypothetical protein